MDTKRRRQTHLTRRQWCALAACMAGAVAAGGLPIPLRLLADAAPPGTPAGEARFPIWESRRARDGAGGEERVYGYIDATGRVAIPARFRDAHSFSGATACVTDDHGLAYINRKGEVVGRPPQGYAGGEFFTEGLAPVNVGGRVMFDGIVGGQWGCIDATGRVVIEPRFEGEISIYNQRTLAFSEGLSAIRVRGKWGYIDRAGKQVIEPTFQDAADFREGLARVQVGGRWEWTDEQGRSHEADAKNEHPGIWKGRKFGYIGRDGKWAIPPRFSDAGDFAGGLASAAKGDQAEGAVGYIDRTGKFVITLGPVRDAFDCLAGLSSFSEGLAAVELEVRDPLPKGSQCGGCGRSLEGLRFGDKCPGCGNERYAPRRWGYVDQAGKVAITPRYQQARPFREGLAAVRVSDEAGGEEAAEVGRWGFIDRAGRSVIPARYVEIAAAGFYDGLARVMVARGEVNHLEYEKWAYIDHAGKVVWAEAVPELDGPPKAGDRPKQDENKKD